MPEVNPSTSWSINTVDNSTTWTSAIVSPSNVYKINNVLIYGSSSSNRITWESITSVWGD